MLVATRDVWMFVLDAETCRGVIMRTVQQTWFDSPKNATAHVECHALKNDRLVLPRGFWTRNVALYMPAFRHPKAAVMLCKV